MKKLFVLVALLLPAAVIGQPMFTSLDVPALTSGPSRTTDGGPMINFDRRILVQIGGASQPAEMCLYINTVTGDIGITHGRSGELGACEINVNDKKFRFMVVRSSGQILVFQTNERNGELRHYLTSGNTEVFPVSFPRMENAELHRSGGVVPGRTRGGLDSHAYQANASAPTFYLYGRSSPAEVTTQGFLGYSGVGYLKTNRGIFMSVRAQLGPTRFNAHSWSSMPTRLDPYLFEQTENILNEKITSSLDRQENKLRNETFSGGCAMEEEELRRMKLEDVEARRAGNMTRNSGNVYESETVRRATGEMMVPNLAVMNQDIVVKICKASERMSRSRRETTRADIERKISCYRTQQAGLSALQAEWNAIDARYPNDAGRAYMEKNRTFGRLASMGASCR